MRNRTLDMVKAICAYAVVLLHVHFPGNAGIIANVLARFAVPVFFSHAAVPCDLQGQGLPAGADEFIRFHAVTVAHPAENRKRSGRDRIRIKRLKEE